MNKVLRYTLIDLARNRFVLAFAFLLLLLSEGLFLLEDDAMKALLSLMQVALAIVPLVVLVFTIVHAYDTQEFVQLLAVQPIARRAILLGRWLALGIAFTAAIAFGLGLPLLLHIGDATAVVFLLAVLLLGWVFAALGTWIATAQRDKARGVGFGIAVWVGMLIVYDALLLWLLFAFSDHPVEPFVVPLAALNPIDLARIAVMLRIDLAALMGYSGAVYQDLFGSISGALIAVGMMLLWTLLPALAAVRSFARKDL